MEPVAVAVLLFFVTAVLYSSVGFGGGSSYLAILALLFTEYYFIRSTSLMCNIIVVVGSTYLYLKRGHLNIKEDFYFLIASIPLSWLGGSIVLEGNIFFVLVGLVLLLSVLSMFFRGRLVLFKKINFTPGMKILVGALLGFVSGLAGIGGGIFLAPVLYIGGWKDSRRIAGLSSFFILINSLAGIAGQAYSDAFLFKPGLAVPLLFAVLVGGQVGSRFSFFKLSPEILKKGTALLVLMVSLRLLNDHVFHLI